MKTDFSVNPYYFHCVYLRESALNIHRHNSFVNRHTPKRCGPRPPPQSPYTPMNVIMGLPLGEQSWPWSPFPLCLQWVVILSSSENWGLQGFSFPLSSIFVAALCLVGELCDGGLAASLYRVPSALLVGITFPQVLEISCPQVKGQW